MTREPKKTLPRDNRLRTLPLEDLKRVSGGKATTDKAEAGGEGI
jgi:hypothetical protein